MAVSTTGDVFGGWWFVPPVAVIGVAVALFITSALAGLQESSPVLVARKSEQAKLAAYAAGEVGPGLSIDAQTAYLLDCHLLMYSIAGMAQTTSVRDLVIGNCLSGARRIIAASPTFSLGWLTVASAQGAKNQQDDFLASFQRSYDTAPSELWLAEMRIDVAGRYHSQLDTSLHQRLEQDVKLLLSTNRGRVFLAPRYEAWDWLREVTDRVLNSLPETSRDRFFRAVKRS